MYLRDLAIYADELIVNRFPAGFVGWFHRETCCITELYLSLVHRKLLTPDTAKVMLRFTDQQSSVRALKQLLTAADAWWLFDFVSYSQKDEPGKKRMILDAAHGALLWIAKERSWQTEGLKNAYAQALARNLEFEGLSKKPWFSPDRRHKARIGFSHGLRTIHFYLIVYDRKGNQLGKKPLGDVAPETAVVHWVLKQKARWNALNRFRLQAGGYCFHLPKKWEVDLTDLLA